MPNVTPRHGAALLAFEGSGLADVLDLVETRAQAIEHVSS